MDTYNFKNVTSTVDGEILTGFMDGTAISVEKNNDDVEIHTGADGSTTWAESNDNSGLITFTLKATSPSLPLLRQLAKDKKEFQVSIIDNNGGKVRFISTQCRIQKAPGFEAGDAVSGVEVPILVADYNPQNG